MLASIELLDAARAQKLLDDGDLQRLFIEELGWDHSSTHLHLSVQNGRDVDLAPVAQKRDLGVFEFHAREGKAFPTYAERAAIETAASKQVREHLIVFSSHDRKQQVWQWAKREIGRPIQRREYTHREGRRADLLIQKLGRLVFTLKAEEEGITVIDVAGRLKAGFDVEPVTRQFYDGFQEQHDALSRNISGIRYKEQKQWYASIMLNRIMFIYFIQEKGFLDGDASYLKTKLAESRAGGNDRFLHTYLYPLFFEALAKPIEQREKALERRIGRVPFLNGGLFTKHALEIANTEIGIPDSAFDELFAFLASYRWHLDERPIKHGKEINPDVLGYIFERYINRAEMGAYYTKEDVTEYVATNAIITRLLYDVGEKAGLDLTEHVWKLLCQESGRYIPAVLQHGCEHELPTGAGGSVAPPSDIALEFETWNDIAIRRKRYFELKARLNAGKIHSANDCVVDNINLRQLLQDAVDRSSSAQFVDAVYTSLSGMTALDPTCGSGAFLFAAMNILEPLYEACLDKMEALLEPEHVVESGVLKRFEAVVTSVEKHPNQRYYILKQISLRNLFGVDIMDEAVEICKLRLFLKLIAQVERTEQIEPLPDLDFNVRAGNALVGFSSYAEIQEVTKKQMPLSLEFGSQVERLEALAKDCACDFDRFRNAQLVSADDNKSALKQKLAKSQAELAFELDKVLFGQQHGRKSLDAWKQLAKPFHWFAEFYHVIASGGFDVVIGNPPFVDYDAALKRHYEVGNLRTVATKNLYGMVVERSLELLQAHGQVGMIVPLSLTFSRNFATLRELLLESGATIRFANFDNIPDRLFTGYKESTNTSTANQQRITILSVDRVVGRGIFATSILRWKASERARLFSDLAFADVTDECTLEVFPKIGSKDLVPFFRRWQAVGARLGDFIDPDGNHVIVVPRTAGYYIAAYPSALERTKQMELSFKLKYHRDLAFIMINSNVFFWRWRALGDAFDVTSNVIMECPAPAIAEDVVADLSKKLRQALKECSTEKMYRGVAVPNVNFNKRLDLLFKVDEVLIEAIGPGSNLTPRDFLWAKSNSCFVLDVPKSNLPVALIALQASS